MFYNLELIYCYVNNVPELNQVILIVCRNVKPQLSILSRVNWLLPFHLPYLVEVQLPHQRAREGVAAVHRHDDRAGVGGAEQGRRGLQQAGGQAGRLHQALLGPHQLLGQGLLQGQGQLAGRGARPAGVRLQREDLGGRDVEENK